MARPDKIDEPASDGYVFKQPGEDLEYDAWFREQVRIGLEQLERGDTVSDDVVKAKWRKRRAELLRQVSDSE